MEKLKELISSPTKQMTEEEKETLNLLYELSEEKVRTYTNQIMNDLRTAGMEEKPTVPIMQVLGAYQEIYVITKDSSDEDITTEIRNGLGGLVPGGKDKIIDGIAGFISTGLRTMLGAENGEECFEKSYYLVTEGSTLVRLDLIYWSRYVNATNIMEHAEKSLVYVVVKSSVDMERVSFGAVFPAYQKNLIQCNLSKEEFCVELENAKEISRLYNPDDMSRIITGAKLPCEQKTIHDFGVLQSNRNVVNNIWPSRDV